VVQILRSLGDRCSGNWWILERGLVNREVYVNPDIYHQETGAGLHPAPGCLWGTSR